MAHSDIQTRLKQARSDAWEQQSRLHDFYAYCMPHRATWTSGQSAAIGRSKIYDAVGMEVVEQFGSQVLNTFTPPYSRWVELQPANAIPNTLQQRANALIEQAQRGLWSEIQRSSAVGALPVLCRELAHGTGAMLVEPGDTPDAPLRFEAVPAPELLLGQGPGGDLDLRGRQQRRPLRDVVRRFGEDALPEDLRRRLDEDGGADIQVVVTDVWVRDRQNLVDNPQAQKPNRVAEAWDYTALVGEAGAASGDEHTLATARLTGRGACPLIVARWHTDPATAWGFGPAYAAMPDIRTLNALRRQALEHAERTIRPPIVYEDDGTYDPEGIGPGTHVAKAPGSNYPQELVPRGTLQTENVVAAEIKRSVQALFLLDEPQQHGRTPPTAAQWRDLASRQARRMGAPAANLTRDLQIATVQRVFWLLSRLGRAPDLDLDDTTTLQVEPRSPLSQAQGEDEAQRLEAALTTAVNTLGPEAVQTVVDSREAVRRLVELYGVTGDLVRSPEEVQRLLRAARQAEAQGADIS